LTSSIWRPVSDRGADKDVRRSQPPLLTLAV
jgi:hypothetical protein